MTAQERVAVMLILPAPYSASSLRMMALSGMPSPSERALTRAQRSGSIFLKM